MKFSIRDVLWLTSLAAVLVGWWLDRRQLAVDYADYDRLKSDEEAIGKEVRQMLDKMNQPAPVEAKIEVRQPVPGDADYRFPPTYPLHYGPSASP
jgi:hypothetical protein